MTDNDFFRVATGDDGIAVLTWDAQSSPVNIFSEPAIEAYRDAIEQLIADDSVRGVVIASAKSVFHVGADLEMAQAMGKRDEGELFAKIMEINAVFRRMETGGKPFVAAINGQALGGGFEMAMACHARILGDGPKVELGLPESKLGLMPGFGGTQRLPRLIALDRAVPMMLLGTSLKARDAVQLGLVTAIVPDVELIAEARSWALANPAAKQPWDEKGFKLPSGSVQSPKNFQFFIGASAQAAKTTGGHHPAVQAILEAVYQGLQLPIDPALRVEARRFVRIAHSAESRSMIRTLFFGMNAANRLARRPEGFAPTDIKTIGIVGAGLMGAGIAYQAARAGIDAVVLDVSDEAAANAKAYSERLLDRDFSRGKTTQDKVDTHLARIQPTTDYTDLARCDLVIEAVFEAKDVKETVLRAVEAVVRPDAIIASNTSTIPITQLGKFIEKSARFIGMHFFSPVEKMPLVEIISGQETAPQTLAAAFDLCKLLRKTPIDVNDGRAFFTTKVVSSYMTEGMALLSEGVAPALIENAGKALGMPMGPLRLADMVNLDLVVKIDDQTKADLGADYLPHPGMPLSHALVAQGRVGEKAKAGFYDYCEGGPLLWSGLAALSPPRPDQPDVEMVKQRLLTIQMVETLRCYDSGVLKTAADADLGSILGWGFPAYTGGIATHIDNIGAAQVLSLSQRFAHDAGKRFDPPTKLKTLAASDGLLHAA